MEKISISGFGGFKDATFETAPIMVFIGEQATGKSIVARLLYFFRSLGPRVPFLGGSDHTEEAKMDGFRDEFCALFPPMNWALNGFKISYTCNGQSVDISCANTIAEPTQQSIHIKWSSFYKEAATKWSRLFTQASGKKKLGGERFNLLRMEFLGEAQKALGNNGTSDQTFVPAGRVSLDKMAQNIFSVLDANEGDLRNSFDPIDGKFLREMDYLKKSFKPMGFFDARGLRRLRLPDVRQRVEKILKAEYYRENEQDYLIHPDSRRVRLANASSGQQAALPLLLTLGRVLSGGARKRDVYFEEPEAHLFPTSQREIIELLAASYKLKEDNVRFVITTHSPYILTTIDNLLEAGKRYEDAAPAEPVKLKKIVPPVFALRPRTVAAYSLSGGLATSIIDEETNLIKGDIIDEVSTELDTQFESLLWET